MKSFTYIHIALLRLMCLSLLVFSLGSVLMAAPAGGNSQSAEHPLVSLEQAAAYSAYRAALPHTYADYFIQPNLDARSAATGKGLTPLVGTDQVSVTSDVQTTDITLPTYPPSIPLDPTTGFPEGGAATPTNVDPVWFHNATYIVFASNRNINPTTGAMSIVSNFHLFLIAASGDPSTLVQLTSGTGNERWPTVLGPNDNQIAFCESATPGGSYSLDQADLGTGSSGTYQISDITPFVNPNIPADVEHPSYGSGIIAFAGGASPTAVHHIYTINIATGVVAQITNGVADERNPSCSQEAGSTLIAFQSNATGYLIPPGPTNIQNSAGANSSGSGDPIYGVPPNNIFVMYYLGTTVPQQVSNGPSGSDNITPSWSTSTTSSCALIWASTGRTDPTTGTVNPNHSIVYLNTTIDPSLKGIDVIESGGNATVLNASDPTHGFDNVEPVATDPNKNDGIAYVTNRYLVNGPDDNPDPGSATGQPAEEPTNPSAMTTGPTFELFTSHTLDVTPPLLLDYSSGEIIHIEDTNSGTTNPVRNAISPGDTLKFTVRMSDRISGVSAIYLQIKDPNSKYQDPFGLEHRVYTRDPNIFHVTDESTTLWEGDAVGGFNGQSPIDLGNLLPISPAISTTLTAATTAGATSITVASTGGMAVGDELQIAGTDYFILGFGTTAGSVNVTPATPVLASGTTVLDIAHFVGEGQEVDAETINLADTSNGGSFDPTIASNFFPATYTPSYEDSVPNSSIAALNEDQPQPYWLKLTQDATQDGNGGVTFSGTWVTPPNYPSDFYVDAIGYDNASKTPPMGSGTQTTRPNALNWLIYDNVWGFSTAPSPTPSGASVLVVDDYALPQKFFSRFGSPGFTGAGNVPVNFYGAESYVTDLDTNFNDVVSGISEAAEPHVGLALPPPGTTGNAVESALLSDWNFNGGSNPPLNPGYANGLGVNSYVDSDQQNVVREDGAPFAPSQEYVVWRLLSRGPIPQSTLLQFAPLQGSQPNPSNPAQQEPVLIANSCVLWLSPFASDERSGAGTITDPTTQANLETFLNDGGRLEIEGIDVGYALTNDGEASSPFYSNYLHASFLTDAVGFNAGTMILSKKDNSVTGQTAFEPDYFEHDAYMNNTNQLVQLNGIGHGGYALPLAGPPGIVYTPPNAATLTIGNFGIAGTPTAERSDASMNASNDELGYIDGFSPNPLNAAEPDGPLTEIYGVLTGAPNNVGNEFIYYRGASGSILIYGSFGLEAISQEVVPFTPTGATSPDFVSVNQRTNLIHNTICNMRTGEILGKVVSSGTASGVAGALVIASINDPVGNQQFTAFTDNSGNFTIAGCPPGNYALSITKGTAHANGTSQLVHGGDTAGPITVVINPQAPGSLQVTVVNGSGVGIAGVSVTATQTPGGNTLPTQITNASGVATFSNVPPDTYDVVADGSAVGYSISQPVPVTVVSAQQAAITITLTGAPATVYGTVNGVPAGSTANVTVTDTTTGKAVGSGTTGATFTVPSNGNGFDGGSANYEITISNPIAGHSYTAVAGLTGYTALALDAQPFTLTFNHGVRQDFNLSVAPIVNVYGIVENGVTNAPVAGATITFTDLSNVAHTVTSFTPAVNATVASGGDGAPANYGVDPAAGTLNFSIPAGTYTVTVSAPGLVSPPSQIITISTTTRIDFTTQSGFPLGPQHQFQPGLTLFSVPYDYGTTPVSQVFQGWLTPPGPTLAVWDPMLSMYDTTGVTPPTGHANLANSVHLGQGYWARFAPAAGSSTIGLAGGGNIAGTTAPFAITLKAGWNMIGDPFLGSVNMSAIQVADSNGNMHSWGSATSPSLNLVSPTIYSYTSPQYVMHYVGSTVGKASDLDPTVDPYVGYWVLAFTTCALELPVPPSAPVQQPATVGTQTNGNPDVVLTWQAAAGATSYDVYRGTSSGGEGTTPYATNVVGTTYTDNSVTSGTKYYYTISAVSANGQSVQSNEQLAAP